MAIALDVIIVLIIVATLFTVVKKGFVNTVLDFASVICAIIFSKMFAPAVSSLFYDGLYRNVSGKISEFVGALINNNNLPEAFESENITAFLLKYNADLADKIGEEAVDGAVQIISQNLVGLLSYAIAFLLIFVLTIVAFKVISVILGSIFKLPILKDINKTLAFLLGVVMSLVYVMLFVGFMQVLIPPLSSVYPKLISTDTVNSTFLFGYLYNFEWFEIFVN